MTHTPGPWKAEKSKSPPYAWYVVGSDLNNVAHDLSKDDARLIAAAPALLEALTRLKQAFDIAADNLEEVEIDGEMIAPIDLSQEVAAAIALATGEGK